LFGAIEITPRLWVGLEKGGGAFPTCILKKQATIIPERAEKAGWVAIGQKKMRTEALQKGRESICSRLQKGRQRRERGQVMRSRNEKEGGRKTRIPR